MNLLGGRAPINYTRGMGSEDEQRHIAIAVALGYRIEQERKKQSLTKEELATRSGMASRYLWRVEAGRQNLVLKNIVAIADGLGITLAALMKGVEKLADDPPPRVAPKPRGPAAKAKWDVCAAATD